MKNRNYILVTPAKNEEESMPNLIKSIEELTLKPVLWVIVDESTDGTTEIIKELRKKYEWVKIIFLKGREGYLGTNYGYACKAGFDFAIGYCKQHGIDYDYIGLMDVDVIVDEDSFERLIFEFEEDPKLGIASGTEYWHVKGKLVLDKLREDLPLGPMRLWRKNCFLETGGYQPVASPDSISNAKAKLRGWKTKQFKDVKIIARRSFTAGGYWRGFVQTGKDYYFLNYPPFLAILKGLKLLFEHPYYIGFAFWRGYFNALIIRMERIDDEEIRFYYRHVRPREIKRLYWGKIKKYCKILSR